MKKHTQPIQYEMENANKALNTVINMGFVVLQLEIGKHNRPTFTVVSTSICKKLVELGQAARFFDDHKDGKHTVKYQYPLNNCRVVWKETL
ncbi:hypothetical protein [Providencia rettgeri]|uniref:hypothetical protein n=1 Tax=Providencia rettgeri TaxID=587 RepID=UPI001C82C371|nr:hypothetical protein [Providencia rettgeri]MBX6974773.1 hypothetical protein [Providencia rettgeri]